MEISKCLERKDGVKMAIIPKRSNIIKGDILLITNDLTLINKFKEEEEWNKKQDSN